MKTASREVQRRRSAVYSGGLLLVGALAVTAPASASATDTFMPTIVHEACPEYEKGEPFVVRARFEDESQLYEPQVVYRLGPDSDWKQTPLTKEAGSEDFTATIEVGDLAEPIEYYIQVFDEHGNGPARMGDTDAPIEVLPADVPAPCRQLPEQKAVTVTKSSAWPEAGREAGSEPGGLTDGPTAVFIAGGVTAAAGVATLVLDIGTGRKADALRDDPNDDEAYNSGRRLQTAERIMFGVTVAAAIAAGALAFLTDFGAKPTEEPSVEVAPAAGGDAAGFVLVGRFW